MICTYYPFTGFLRTIAYILDSLDTLNDIPDSRIHSVELSALAISDRSRYHPLREKRVIPLVLPLLPRTSLSLHFRTMDLFEDLSNISIHIFFFAWTDSTYATLLLPVTNEPHSTLTPGLGSSKSFSRRTSLLEACLLLLGFRFLCFFLFTFLCQDLSSQL